jgi:hypothetical protein
MTTVYLPAGRSTTAKPVVVEKVADAVQPVELDLAVSLAAIYRANHVLRLRAGQLLVRFRRICAGEAPGREIRFAVDSPVEGGELEPSVPLGQWVLVVSSGAVGEKPRASRASAPLAKGHDLRTVPWRFIPQHLV